MVVAGLFSVCLSIPSFAQPPGPLSNPPPPRTQPPPARDPPPPAAQPEGQQAYHTSPPPQGIHSPGDNPITSDPPSMPVDDIIKRFAERESEFKRERDNYTYTQAFSIQTIDEENRPDGEYRMTSDIIFTQIGRAH